MKTASWNSIIVTVSPSWTADAAKMNGNIARDGSVGPQVSERAKCIAPSYAEISTDKVLERSLARARISCGGQNAQCGSRPQAQRIRRPHREQTLRAHH